MDNRISFQCRRVKDIWWQKWHYFSLLFHVSTDIVQRWYSYCWHLDNNKMQHSRWTPILQTHSSIFYTDQYIPIKWQQLPTRRGGVITQKTRITILPLWKCIILTPWWRVLLEKLTGLQLAKKFPTFHGTRSFITELTSVHQLSLSWASPIQSIYTHPTILKSEIHLIISSSCKDVTELYHTPEQTASGTYLNIWHQN